jgi:hypothetical protein
MQKVKRSSVVFLIGFLSVIAGGRSAWAATPLQYHGGPFLEKFEICPLYYGQWTQSEIDAQQAYLVNLAAYMSGKYAPTFEQPMMKQYGANDVTVASAATTNPHASAGVLTRAQIPTIIAANQASKNLLAFGPHRLIMVFTGKDVTVDCGNTGCGYHHSESGTAFWAAVPLSAGPSLALVTAHEVFEASADPAIDTDQGWDEAVDNCSTILSLPTFGPSFQIPGAHDNTNGGACSTTGYTSLGELQDYEVTHDQLLSDYNTFQKQGWRLYILQSYVLNNGDVRHNAVWRPGNLNEKLLLGGTLAQFQNEYSTLSSEGWNLYILQSYVLAGGEVLYNAVWQPGNRAEQPLLAETHSQFVSDFNTHYEQGWRLYILQTYVTATGEVLYNSVWRPGDLDESDSQQMTLARFETVYGGLYPLGWRLYILQSYVVPGQVLYNAVWRQGVHDETAVYGWTYADYRAKYDAIYPDGWRLYVLNTYVLPNGDVRYDAVWRLGTIDRPL